MTDSEIKAEKLINGFFVYGLKIEKDVTGGLFAIKISSIKSIESVKNRIGEDACFFYTSKGCCYFLNMPANSLREAIDCFMFNRDKYWERYGY